MKTALRINGRGQPISEAVKSQIEEKAAKLDQFYPRITGCSVTVETFKNRDYHLRIDVTVPGNELVVTHEHRDDLPTAVHDAFEAAYRQLQTYADRRRGKVKHA
jgi:ribosomal subunit interface protein